MYNVTKNPELVALAQQVYNAYQDNKGSITRLCAGVGLKTSEYYRIKKAGKLQESAGAIHGRN